MSIPSWVEEAAAAAKEGDGTRALRMVERYGGRSGGEVPADCVELVRVVLEKSRASVSDSDRQRLDELSATLLHGSTPASTSTGREAELRAMVSAEPDPGKKQGARAAVFFLCCALLTSGAAIYCAWAEPCTGGFVDDSSYADAILPLMVAAAVLWMLTVLALAVSAIGTNEIGCGGAIGYLFAILFAVVVVLPLSGIMIWAVMDSLC